MSKTFRRFAWLAIRLLFVGVILLFVFSRVDLSAFIAQARSLDLGYVLLGLVFWCIALLIVALRWKVLMDVSLPGTRLWSLFVFNFVGIFYNQFLPGSIAGDVVKGYYLARTQANKINIYSSVLMDRIIGIIANGVLGVIALATNALVLQALQIDANLPPMLLALTAIGLVVGYVLLRVVERWADRLPGFIAPVYQSARLYLRHPAALLKAAAISVLFFLIWTLSVWCLALSARLRMLDFPTALLILAAVNVAQLIPLSVNGWGVREGALIVLLSAYAVPPEQALLVSLLVAAAGLLTAVIGGIIVLADYRYIRETQSTAAQSGSAL
jgi:uncharacterized protein (TIRG00374 family)